MADKVIAGTGYDWTPNNKTKVKVAWFCMIMSFIIWAGYSTPNTADLCISFTKNLKVLYIPNGGIILGLVLGVGLFSVGEILLMYLVAWKRSVILGTFLVIFMGVSIFASIGFESKALLNVNMQNEKVNDHRNLVEMKRQAIHETRKQIYNLDARINQDTMNGRCSPNWVYARRRQANTLLQEQTNELENLTRNKLTVQEQIGAVLQSQTWDPNTVQGVKSFIAIIAEIALVGFGLLGIGLRQSNTDENEKLRLIGESYRKRRPSNGRSKMKVKPSTANYNENWAESESENFDNKNERIGRNFHKQKIGFQLKNDDFHENVKNKGNEKIRQKGEQVRYLVTKIYNRGIQTNAGIARVMKEMYPDYKISAQRVSQIRKELGLK